MGYVLRFLLVGLSVFVLTFLVACGNSENTSSNKKEEGKIELRWSMWADTSGDKKIWQELADKVTEKYPNIEVNLQTSPFSGYFDKLITQISSGTAPDIVSLQATRIPTFAQYDAIEPLGSYIKQTPKFDKKDYVKGILDAFSYKGKQLIIPYDYGPLILYYNKDIFDKYGVEYPKKSMTWDEFLKKAKAVTKDVDGDGEPETYGYAFSNSFDQIIPWIWNNGGHYLNEQKTKTLIQKSKSTEAIQFVGDLVHKYQVAMPISDPGNLNFDTENFFAGKVAMMIDGPWNISTVREKAKFNWNISTIPMGEAGPVVTGNGSGFGIYSGSEHKQAAWKAISVITGKESEKYLAKNGRAYPARKSAMKAFKESVNKSSLNFEAVINATNNSTPVRTTDNWQRVSHMLTNKLGKVWFENVPAQKVTNEIEPLFNKLLKKESD